MMRKLLLLIPVGLFALTGISWITVTSIQHTATTPKSQPLNEQELFTQSEMSLRQMMRNGNPQESKRFSASLDSLEERLDNHSHSTATIDELKNLIAQYRQDGSSFSKHISPYSEQLQHAYEYETAHADLFVATLDQIGLYELMNAYGNLQKIRKTYIKEPSNDAVLQYRAVSKMIRSEITDLYLGSNIEKPLLDYLDNHSAYLETVRTAYNDIGYTRIYRLRSTGYAIRSTLGLLPRT